MALSWRGGDASKRIASQLVTWANNDPASTEKLVDLGSPDAIARQPNPGLLVIVRNPSAVTALTGEVRVRYPDETGAARNAFYTSLAFARSNGDGESVPIDIGLIASGGQISLKNVTQLGVADTFSALVTVYAF